LDVGDLHQRRLLHVAGAAGLVRHVTRRLQRWQQERDEQRDDADDHQQLDEREAARLA
jgi:hypothetical protein